MDLKKLMKPSKLHENRRKRLSQSTDEITQLRSEYLEIRFNVKEIMTEDEWETVFKSVVSM